MASVGQTAPSGRAAADPGSRQAGAPRIRVLLAEDQALIRRGLRTLLEAEPDIQVVDEAVDGEEAITKAKALDPDIVLMDIRMPVRDGIEATRLVKEQHPRAEVIILSAYEDDELVFEAIQAGATGYVLKDITPENLVRAIRAVHRGQAMMHPSITRKLVERLSSLAKERAVGTSRIHSDGLTDREVEILVEMARGASNREIAAKLYVSESTVKSHLRSIYKKINVRDRAQAVAYTLRKGLIR